MNDNILMNANYQFMTQRRHINSLTGLRFFAAVWVISLHYLSAPDSLPFLKGLTELGARAVLLFFILSGFVLTYTYAGRKVGTGAYFLSRFSRIYPLYILGIILGLPFVFIMSDMQLTRQHLFPVLAAYVTGTQAWYPQDGLLRINQPLWSVSVEIFFYLLFPFMVKKTFLIAKNFRITVLFCLALILGYLFLQEKIYPFTYASFPALYKTGVPVWGWNPLVNLPLFLLGMLLGSIYLHLEKVKDKSYAADILIGVTLLFLMFVKLPSYADLLMTLVLFSLCIFTLPLSHGPISNLLSSGPLQILGNSSYALYILHSPVWHYYEFIYADVFGLNKSFTLVFKTGYVLVSILIAVCIHKGFEKPVRAFLKRVCRLYLDSLNHWNLRSLSSKMPKQ